MTKKIFLLGLTLALAGAAVGCGDDDDVITPPPVDGGRRDMNTATDGGPVDGGGGPDVDGGPSTATCGTYCAAIAASCTAANAQYPDTAACLLACSDFPTDGEDGATAGDNIQCRIYHAGAAATDAATHCSHAGASGGTVCGALPVYDFRTDPDSAFVRFDRMGMPAVATALIPSARKTAYNGAGPTEDAAGAFAGDIVSTLTGIHMALDDDLAGAGLDPCSMTGGAMSQCITQRVGGAGGPTVVSLILPDTLQINTDAAAGFPNGRMLPDPVVDVTLAVVLLDMVTTAPDALAALPLNPTANDKPFTATFPFLATPHTAAP